MSEDLPDCESEAIEMCMALYSVIHMDICSTPPADFNHNRQILKHAQTSPLEALGCVQQLPWSVLKVTVTSRSMPKPAPLRL
jgi:hypothetical protein